MAVKKLGKQTAHFTSRPRFAAGSAIVGKHEAEGNLAKYFKHIVTDDYYGEDTFEKTERKMFIFVINDIISQAGVKAKDIDMIIGGDLLNQIVSQSYATREFDYIDMGVYSACATMAQSIGLGASFVDGGFYDNIVCVTGSHFSTAERQYRFPLEYGSIRALTSQWTVTGAGASLVSNEHDCAANCPIITCATFGKVTDYGIKDANNMGAAMAPAALSTLVAHLEDTGYEADKYDLIVTGDLGKMGSRILRDLAAQKGITLGGNYTDCGLMMYKDNGTDQGGSGAGCSAAVLNSYILEMMKTREINSVLFIATGALMSPLTIQQNETIPCIAHAVAFNSAY